MLDKLFRHVGTIIPSAILLVAMVLFNVGAVRAMPFYTISVTETQDENDVLLDGTPTCSLREAIAMVNGAQFADGSSGCIALESVDAGAHTLLLEAKNYSVDKGKLVISTSDALEIQGQGAGETVIKGDDDRIFHLDNGDDGVDVSIKLERLSLMDGEGDNDLGLGVAALNDAAGAIFSKEALELDDVYFADNDASFSGVLRQIGGSLSINNSEFRNNDSTKADGAIYVQDASSLSISDSVFVGNDVVGAVLQVVGVADVQISRSSWVNNETDSGASGSSPYQDNFGTIGLFDSNVTIINSTLSGNRASATGSAGIYAKGGALDIQYSTIYNNSISSANVESDSDFTQWVGGLYVDSNVDVSISATVLSGNNGYRDGGGTPIVAAYDCYGLSDVNSKGFNFLGDVSDCVISEVANGASNILDGGEGAKLNPTSSELDLNPSAFFHLPKGDSPLLNAIHASNEICSSAVEDQRGYSRSSGACDIGSVEYRNSILTDDAVSTKETDVVKFNIFNNDLFVEYPARTTLGDDGVSITQAQVGSLGYNQSSGQITYSANPGVFGVEEQLTYSTRDANGVETNTASISITINEYQGPTLNPDSGYTVNANSNTGLDIFANDEIGDAPLVFGTLDFVQGQNSQVSCLVCTGPVGGIFVRFSPNEGFSGTDSFSYSICDENGKCDGPVEVTVNVLAPPPQDDDDDGGSISWLVLGMLALLLARRKF